jgi:hypothetical protein
MAAYFRLSSFLETIAPAGSSFDLRACPGGRPVSGTVLEYPPVPSRAVHSDPCTRATSLCFAIFGACERSALLSVRLWATADRPLVWRHVLAVGLMHL